MLLTSRVSKQMIDHNTYKSSYNNFDQPEFDLQTNSYLPPYLPPYYIDYLATPHEYAWIRLLVLPPRDRVGDLLFVK